MPSFHQDVNKSLDRLTKSGTHYTETEWENEWAN